MERLNMCFVGSPRCGKSHLANELIKEYIGTGATAIVYNLGLLTDFKVCEYAELLTMREHEEIIYKTRGKQSAATFHKFPEFLYFRYKGNVYNIKHLNKIFAGKAVKFARLYDSLESAFISALFFYVSNALIVIDDSKELFRYGLNAEFIRFFSKCNHFGTRRIYNTPTGCDLLFIMHSLEDVNSQFFKYVNTFVQFRYLSKPNFKELSLNNNELETALKDSFDLLKNEPKYSYTVHPNPQEEPDFFYIVNP